MPTLKVSVIGDSGPFSQLGKSIGYLLEYGDCRFLVDCGAPIFQILGRDGLRTLDGVVATHAHADHQRWFTDLALYRKFNEPESDRLKLYGADRILEDYRWVSSGALEKTLSPDSRSIRSLNFEDYVDSQRIGPEPKYRCTLADNSNKSHPWHVVNRDGDPVPRDRAKVVHPEGALIPRMLFRDPDKEIWVEPETFYPFDDERFYVQEKSFQTTLHEDLTVEPVQSTAWHGPPTTSLLFRCSEGSLFMSSDTVYDPDLWESLTDTERQNHDQEASFREKAYIRGKIEDYVEQVWSERRLRNALSHYDDDHVVLHDVSTPESTVHTTYDQLEDHESPLLLTHSPDEFVTVDPMAHIGKCYVLRNGNLIEQTRQGKEYSLKATCYVKEFSTFLVGYEDPEGNFYLVKKAPGQYEVCDDPPGPEEDHEKVVRIALYEDIGGEYFPVLRDEGVQYHIRPDDRVIRLEHGEEDSTGVLVTDHRKTLQESYEPELSL